MLSRARVAGRRAGIARGPPAKGWAPLAPPPPPRPRPRSARSPLQEPAAARCVPGRSDPPLTSEGPHVAAEKGGCTDGAPRRPAAGEARGPFPRKKATPPFYRSGNMNLIRRRMLGGGSPILPHRPPLQGPSGARVPSLTGDRATRARPRGQNARMHAPRPRPRPWTGGARCAAGSSPLVSHQILCSNHSRRPRAVLCASLRAGRGPSAARGSTHAARRPGQTLSNAQASVPSSVILKSLGIGQPCSFAHISASTWPDL